MLTPNSASFKSPLRKQILRESQEEAEKLRAVPSSQPAGFYENAQVSTLLLTLLILSISHEQETALLRGKRHIPN